MRPSKEFLTRKFGEFNELIFSGKLPVVPCLVSRSKSYMGALKYKVDKALLGPRVVTDIRIVVSSVYDQSEQELEDTLIHEMIHLYIIHNKIKDSGMHGELFQRMMNDINNRFGRHITIRHKTTEAELATDNTDTLYYICVIKETSGETMLAQVPFTRIHRLQYILKQESDIQSIDWYVSLNNYFHRFSRSIHGRFYKIDPAKLHQQLIGSYPAEFKGNNFCIDLNKEVE